MIRDEYHVAGLFAGVGGLELGLSRAGHKTRLLCENDKGAQAVLTDRFPEAVLHSDVRTLKVKDLPEGVDLLAGGFPCQDLSQAGLTAGIAGTKSSLVGQVFRLLRKHRTPWVLLENVPFMLHLERGRAMDHVVTKLERLGYRWAYRVVDAMAFGLPQRRRRVFLAASLHGNPADVLFADESPPPPESRWDGSCPVGFYWTEGNTGVGWAVDSVPTLKGGSGLGIPSPPAVLLPDGRVVTPSLTSAELLQGFERNWTQAAEDEVPWRYRWRMVGNAVNVLAASWLGERLARPGSFDEARLEGRIGSTAWPNAACNLGDGRWAVKISEWPKVCPRVAIETFLKDAAPLSARATEGFVFRAERAVLQGKLKFPAGFLEKLRAHLGSVRGAGSLSH